jgi:hypothetical protein
MCYGQRMSDLGFLILVLLAAIMSVWSSRRGDLLGLRIATAV